MPNATTRRSTRVIKPVVPPVIACLVRQPELRYNTIRLSGPQVASNNIKRTRLAFQIMYPGLFETLLHFEYGSWKGTAQRNSPKSAFLVFQNTSAAWDFISQASRHHSNEILLHCKKTNSSEVWTMIFEMAFDVDGNYGPYKPTVEQIAPQTIGDAAIPLATPDAAAVAVAEHGFEVHRSLGRRQRAVLNFNDR